MPKKYFKKIVKNPKHLILRFVLLEINLIVCTLILLGLSLNLPNIYGVRKYGLKKYITKGFY
jgi:hypothetical protein